MASLIETYALGQILQPFQAPDLARLDAAAFGPSLTIFAGQAVALKTADGKLYPYSSSATLSAPAAPTFVVASGGALTAGNYLYRTTTLFGSRESAKGTETATVTTTGGNLTVNLTVPVVAGATGYKIYRTAAGGASDSETFLVQLPQGVNTFSDTGAIALGAASPPSAATSALSDGTQTGVGLSQYTFVTDASGKAYKSFSVTPGVTASAVSTTRHPPESTMPYYYRGTFDPADLYGVDALFITALGGHTKANGAVFLP